MTVRTSVERVILPDAAAVCEHALNATTRMVVELVVNTEVLQFNIERAGPALASSMLQADLQGAGCHGVVPQKWFANASPRAQSHLMRSL
jgi:adenylosuccinate lyase